MPTFDFSLNQQEEIQIKNKISNNEKVLKKPGKGLLDTQEIKFRMIPESAEQLQLGQKSKSFRVRNYSEHQNPKDSMKQTSQNFAVSNLASNLERKGEPFQRTARSFHKTFSSKFTRTTQAKMSQFITIPLVTSQFIINGRRT